MGDATVDNDNDENENENGDEMDETEACPDCEGQGYVVCEFCDGSGKVNVEYRQAVLDYEARIRGGTRNG